jgi:hypothetical protein
MRIDIGVENGGTPIGDRKSLEELAKQVNERERIAWLQKQKIQQDQNKTKVSGND